VFYAWVWLQSLSLDFVQQIRAASEKLGMGKLPRLGIR